MTAAYLGAERRNVRHHQPSGSAVGVGYYASLSNCRAQVNLIVIGVGFYFDYSAHNGGSSKITRYWGDHYHVIGADLSNHRLQRFFDTQVRYSADLTVAFKGFPAGWKYMSREPKLGRTTTGE